MKIHTSHSRKELLQVIQQFNIDIPNKDDYSKKEIQVLLTNKLLQMDEIQEEDEYFFVKSKLELVEYLSKPNQSKMLTIKEKDQVMLTAKKIIGYCKNSYFLTPYNYECFDDLLLEAEYIAKFGDIPSCRRAVTMLNQDPKLDYKIELILSKRVKKDLEKREAVKQSCLAKYTLKYGKFTILFD